MPVPRKSFYYSGTDETDAQHRHGVEILINNSLKRYVKNMVAYSERIILLQLAGTLLNINIIQIYAPTVDKQISEVTMNNYTMY